MADALPYAVGSPTGRASGTKGSILSACNPGQPGWTDFNPHRTRTMTARWTPSVSRGPRAIVGPDEEERLLNLDHLYVAMTRATERL